MTKKPNLKAAGTLLTVAAFVFVGRSIWQQRESLLLIDLKTVSSISLAGILAYLVASIMLAVGWKLLLNWFGETHLDFHASIWAYGKAQILKYIPGNLLFLPKRHLLSLERGADHAPLAGSATFEVIGLLASASCISILGVLFTQNFDPRFSVPVIAIILMMALASPIILKYVLSIGFVREKLPVSQNLTWGKYSRLLAIWSLHACFFVIVGFILFWAASAVSVGVDVVPLHTALFAFSISWLLGTITPGAPAGAGIREGIMILILSPYIGESNSVSVSLVMRIITMLGDTAFYLVSLYIEKKFIEPTQNPPPQTA